MLLCLRTSHNSVDRLTDEEKVPLCMSILCGLILQIFYLNENPHPALRKHIDGLPALYLDCNEDIDPENDDAVRQTYARQIKDFSNHVRALRESRWAAMVSKNIANANIAKDPAVCRIEYACGQNLLF